MSEQRGAGGDPFKELDKQLKELRRAEQRCARKTDWSDAEAKREHVKELKRRRRRERLDLVVPDRRCPTCGVTKSSSRAWVLFSRAKIAGSPYTRVLPKRAEVAVCRSCAMTKFKEEIWS